MEWLLIIILLPISLYVLIKFITIFTWLFANPPSIPTDTKARKIIANLIEQHYSKSPKLIYDLGSGYGDLAFAIAKKYPDTQIISIEKLWYPLIIAKIKSKIFGYKNVKFIRGDYFKQNYQDADIIVGFFIQSIMDKVEQKLKNSGTLLISNNFYLPNTEPKEIVEIKYLIGIRKIFIYQL